MRRAPATRRSPWSSRAGLAFISGQVAARSDSSPAPAGHAAQADLVVANARIALAAVGAAPQDIVMARVYVVGLTPEVMEAAMPRLFALFDGAQPSLTGVGVAALAAPDLLLEVEWVVRLPD